MTAMKAGFVTSMLSAVFATGALAADTYTAQVSVDGFGFSGSFSASTFQDAQGVVTAGISFFWQDSVLNIFSVCVCTGDKYLTAASVNSGSGQVNIAFTIDLGSDPSCQLFAGVALPAFSINVSGRPSGDYHETRTGTNFLQTRDAIGQVLTTKSNFQQDCYVESMSGTVSLVGAVTDSEGFACATHFNDRTK